MSKYPPHFDSTFKPCDTCGEPFLGVTATTCDECKRRIYEKAKRQRMKERREKEIYLNGVYEK